MPCGCCSGLNLNESDRLRRQQDSRWSYLVCAGATFCQAINMGLLMSFGVLFPVIIRRFNSNRQETAWIGSLASFLCFFASPVAGRLSDKLNCRYVTMIGVVSSAVGLLLSSFANRIIVYYFTYSLLVGFGVSCVRTSSFLVVAQYFCEKKPFATGILSAGAGLGLFVLAPVIRAFLDSFSLDNTFRFLAGIVLVGWIPALLYDPSVEENGSDPQDSNSQLEEEDSELRAQTMIVDCSVWTVPAFTVFTLGFMMDSLGASITRIHLVKYCEDIGISAQRGSQLFIYIGLASSISRLVSGRLCNNDRVNPVYIYQSGIMAAGLAAFMLPFTTEYWILIAFSVIYGLSDGVFAKTQCYILLTTVDSKRTTAAFCMNNVLSSFPSAAGGPVAALIADHTGSYIYSFYMTGGVLLTASLIPIILIFVHRKTYNVQQQNWETS